MSQFPPIVTTGVWVPDGIPNHPGAAPVMIWIRAGTAVDIKPGSKLKALYGAGNLSGVITHTGDPCNFDKSVLSKPSR
jgi:hypothetical protein